MQFFGLELLMMLTQLIHDVPQFSKNKKNSWLPSMKNTKYAVKLIYGNYNFTGSSIQTIFS